MSINLSSAPLLVAVNSSQKQRMMSRRTIYDVTPLHLAERSKKFGTESAYYGIILRNYSDYLFDRGQVAEGYINRLAAWRIFAEQSKHPMAALTAPAPAKPTQDAPEF